MSLNNLFEDLDLNSIKTNRFDPDKKETTAPSFRRVIKTNLPLGKMMEHCLRQFIILPSPDIQFPIVAAGICSNALLAECLPHFWFIGPTGSGKSTNLKFLELSRTDKSEIDGFGDSIPGMRDELHKRVWDEDLGEKLHGAWVSIDNLMPSWLQSESEGGYKLLIKKFEKSSAHIIRQEALGRTKTFDIFGTTFLTSISPLWMVQEYHDLTRRTAPIICRPLEKISEKDLEGQTRIDKILKINSFNWEGFKDLYFDFWTPSNCLRYRTLRTACEEKGNFLGLSSALTQPSIDLFCTLVITKIADDYDHAKQIINRYWNLVTDFSSNSNEFLKKILQDFLDEIYDYSNIKQAIIESRKEGKNVIPFEISTKDVVKFTKQEADALALGKMDAAKIDALLASFDLYRQAKHGKVKYVLKID